MPKRFTYWILGGMILGIVLGYILHAAITDPKELGALLRAIEGYSGQPATRLALQL